MFEIVMGLFKAGTNLYMEWKEADDAEKVELEKIARARQAAGDEAEMRIRAESDILRAKSDEARRRAIEGDKFDPAKVAPKPDDR